MAPRVLLIDDEEELVSSMSERLSFRGIDSRFVTSGLAALEIVRETDFDVIVMDVKMPGLSGVNLMCRIDEIQGGLRYIFLTGHGSESDYRACCEAGAFSYLIKPIDIEELLLKIQEAAT